MAKKRSGMTAGRCGNKELRALFKRLERIGLTVVLGSGGHFKIYRDETFLLSCSGTPRGPYAIQQIIRDLRRYHGIEVQ